MPDTPDTKTTTPDTHFADPEPSTPGGEPVETAGPAKARWRHWIRRVAVPVAGVDAAGVRRNLARLLDGVGGMIVSYDALPGEVDPEPVLINRGHDSWALTRTPPSGELTVNVVTAGLERHRFGFRQPVAGAPAVPDREVGAILVPGLAFDRRGVRLGHGAGYYDRLLARFTGRIPLIGVGPTTMIVPRLPREDHDIPLTHLVTEAGVEVLGVGTGDGTG